MRNKAVSQVVATILVLMITVGIAGSAWIFIQSGLTGRVSESFQIIDSSNLNVFVKNLGTQNISDMTAFLDGSPIAVGIQGGGGGGGGPVGPWWNTIFQNKRLIIVTNALANYQIPLNLTFNTHYKTSDCSDIRFTNSSENEEFDYWVESFISSNWCYVWVEARQADNFYLYYNNNTPVSSNSNPRNTMLYYDNGGFLTSWFVSGSAGQSATEGNPLPSYFAVSTLTSYLNQNIGLIPQTLIQIDIRTNGLGALFFLVNSAGAGQGLDADTRSPGACPGDKDDWYTTSSWTGWVPAGCIFSGIPINTWKRYLINVTSTTAFVWRMNPASLSFSGTSIETGFTSKTIANNGGFIGLVGDGLGASFTSWFDNIVIRKFVSPEPSTSIGAEESPSAGGGGGGGGGPGIMPNTVGTVSLLNSSPVVSGRYYDVKLCTKSHCAAWRIMVE